MPAPQPTSPRRRWPGRDRRTRGPRAAAWRRVVLRRLAAAVLAGVACWLALGPYAARGGPPTSPAVVATADLPLGHVLRPDDLRVRAIPQEAVPAAALREVGPALGRPLTAAVGEGETVTATRVRSGGPPLPPGQRALHVPLADPGAAARLAAGDHVDLVAVADGALVVADAVVVDIDRATTGGFGASEAGRGLTVAVPADKVGALTAAALGARGGVHVAARPPG